MPVFESLNTEMQRIKSKAPQTYMAQVLDTEKRLSILFDHLNNQDVLKADTIDKLKDLSEALQGRQYEAASAVLTELMTSKTDEGSNWMVSQLMFL
jgi:protein transport protein SEC31